MSTLTLSGNRLIGSPLDGILSIQHHPSNRLTSASFTPPPRKGIWEKIIEALTRRIEP
ncbi:hypothetical protein [Yersinia frederiksenii]|uniref:hypothetical protein n=1 Tax=Yersinia frederiksenii TaxID=29484 RepID=UPI0005EA3B2C|nr:hypothetical protein [Yersinia frederiksenii]CNL10100.1 Uncharacterised protein [Yersinia frederiksenii]